MYQLPKLERRQYSIVKRILLDDFLPSKMKTKAQHSGRTKRQEELRETVRMRMLANSKSREARRRRATPAKHSLPKAPKTA